MLKKNNILTRIKEIVSIYEPEATVILYGSFARGEQKESSDIDILILVNKEKITYSDEKRIKYPLYELEFETGILISPIIFSRKDWEIRHKITPFYKNVKREGILL
jgi:predicted nucleotidyltransferase